jgi:MoxR-like ATPase
MAITIHEVIKMEQKMLTIFADALLIAARQNPLPYPKSERPMDPEADRAWRRFWLNYAGLNR